MKQEKKREPAAMTPAIETLIELRERNEDYRDVTGLVALIAGTLASSLSLLFVAIEHTSRLEANVETFVGFWGTSFVLLAGLTTYFLWKRAHARGETFISRRLKLAVACFSLPLAFGAILTFMMISYNEFAWFYGSFDELVQIWVFFYGWALLNTYFFAPRPLPALGAAFLIASLLFHNLGDDVSFYPFDFNGGVAHLMLLTTFGGFHLYYALATRWLKPWRK